MTRNRTAKRGDIKEVPPLDEVSSPEGVKPPESAGPPEEEVGVTIDQLLRKYALQSLQIDVLQSKLAQRNQIIAQLGETVNEMKGKKSRAARAGKGS